MKDQQSIERLSPLRLGFAISASLIVILLVMETVLGRWDQLASQGQLDPLARVSEGILRDLRLAIMHCLLIGYIPAALLHVLRSGRRTVLVLQDVLSCTREECEALAAAIRLRPRGLVITGVIGVALAFLTPYLVPPVPEALWSPSSWNAEVTWHRILGPLTMLGGFWLGYAIVTVSLRMWRIANKLHHIDLFDLSALSPFTQLGLTHALLLIGLLSIWSLVMLETGFKIIMILIAVTTLVFAVLAMLGPVYGVHRRIRQSKEAELNWVNGQISERWTAFKNHDAGQHSGEIADLLAYRGYVDSVSEWPFTTSTYTRLFLYALIPIASWGIGVVAEEIIGRMLSF